MYQVVDNFVDMPYQQALLARIDRNEAFPWGFLQDMSHVEERSNIEGAKVAPVQHGFETVLYLIEEQRENQYTELLWPFINTIMYHEQSNIRLLRVKAGLVLPSDGVIYPHVDFSFPHKSLVYYVNDTDGDTVFYKEHFTGHDSVPETFTVEERISPQQGRAVIFDGLQYHSTEYPTNHHRTFLNINYEVLQ